MSRITRTLESWRLHDWKSKFYFDAPITVRASHLEDIATALRITRPGTMVRLFVNGREVQFDTTDYRPQVADSVQGLRQYEEVRSIALTNGFVAVSLARAASVMSSSTDPQHLGTMSVILDVLEGAKWPFGTFVFRHLGGMFAATLSFLVALYGFDLQPISARNVAARSVVIALVVIVGLTVLIGLRRMVRLDVRLSHERGKGGAWRSR